ncbi:hypothetical protein [Staphylococcus sp. HMSC056G08]|jgi:hypothetical protein|uniref:hypothetical protein n=1 Tax=Staphylococcus sp. HMSC056G08 TaxID=1739350 RepID=UPI0008A2F8DC|nr:hypothetical protein [Staphylococcus sp. HMSC056G08]OFJ81030.1 hypothetical protein HMPREF2846_00010 [Staphylococcus sp. HMSC056G08]HCV7170068.1 replication initiation protein [Staphylococcus aureus]
MKNNEINNFGLTGLSNSRLSVTSVTQNEKISVVFDRITVVGYLIEGRERQLKNYVERDPRINLRDTGFDKFKAHALDNKVYVEYDRRLAKQLNRSEIRVEFNPSKLSDEEKDFIQFVFLDNMRGKEFSRIDLAFDLPINLADFYIMSDKSLKKTIFYGRNDKPETKYFGVRDSERYIRIYNKKLQLSEVDKKEIEDEYLWRIEFELKRSMTQKWDKCFDDLQIIKPKWKTVENQQKRAMVYMLLNELDEWSNLQRRTKYRYKKLLNEISDEDISDVLRETLNNNHEKLRAELENYIAISHHDKLYNFDLG